MLPGSGALSLASTMLQHFDCAQANQAGLLDQLTLLQFLCGW